MITINPRVDIAFKKIFGVEENMDLLISLINSIVSKEDQVSEIQILNPYNAQDFRGDKLSILDIKAVGPTGKRFNIEIQITDESDYSKRGLYYWAKLYIEQLSSAGKYSSLNKAIGIHILNFTSIPNNNKYHNAFHITEKETGLCYFQDLELHTIELTKFCDPDDKFSDFIPKIKTSLDMWAAFLIRHDLLKGISPLPENDALLQKALHVVERMNFTPGERAAYEEHLKWLMIEASALEKAETKGREEGKVEGREQGEFSKATQIAQAMLKRGMEIALIQEMTGLSRAEIENLMHP